jgi:hypothetical protein
LQRSPAPEAGVYSPERLFLWEHIYTGCKEALEFKGGVPAGLKRALCRARKERAAATDVITEKFKKNRIFRQKSVRQ